jgi:hypothetical protein
MANTKIEWVYLRFRQVAENVDAKCSRDRNGTAQSSAGVCRAGHKDQKVCLDAPTHVGWKSLPLKSITIDPFYERRGKDGNEGSSNVTEDISIGRNS